MHIPDGFVNLPTAAVAGGVSLGVVALSARKASRGLGERTVPLLGVTAAFVFAAQMLNFPVAGGTSGHFLGALLIGALLGPYAAVVVLTAVLAVQSLVMADGGITALGANVFNMAIVGGLLGYLIFAALKRLLPKTATGYFFAVAVASWFSIVLASMACAVELALSGTVSLSVALPMMVSVHMVIGLGEALITSTVVAAVLASRPDLVKTYEPGRGRFVRGQQGARAGRRKLWGFVAGALVVALALAVFVSPFASSRPDGLERVLADSGAAEKVASGVGWSLAPIADYMFPGIHDPILATALAGLAGALVLFALLLFIGRILDRRPSGRPDEHCRPVSPACRDPRPAAGD